MIRSLEALLTRRHIKHLSGCAITWLWKHEDQFRISHEADRALPWQIKPLIELMFLLTTFKRHGIESQTLDRLAAGALEQANDFDWHELAAYDPSAATPLALVSDFFSCHHRPAPFGPGYFSFMNDISFFEGMDRVPYREMDLAHSLSRVVSAEYEQMLPVWFSRTAFGLEQSIARYTTDDIYSLTHAVFYLTDMGLRDVESLLDSATVARLRQTLVTLSSLMLRGDNVDVLGELLLCWIFCGVHGGRLNDLIFDQSMRRILAFSTADGAVAPTLNTYQLQKSGKASFMQIYHTTLVAGLLFTLLSQKYAYGDRLVA